MGAYRGAKPLCIIHNPIPQEWGTKGVDIEFRGHDEAWPFKDQSGLPFTPPPPMAVTGHRPPWL